MSNASSTKAPTTERRKSWVEMTDRRSEWFTWADIIETTGGAQTIVVRVTGFKQGKISQSNKRVVSLDLATATGKLPKPLGLNATNARQISAIYGTDKPADWVERQIILSLYVGQDRDPQGGGTCNCVRVHKRKPTAAELHGARYDRASALALLESAADRESLESARATIKAQRPPAEHYAEIKQAIADAEERVAAGEAMAAEAGESPGVEAAE